MRQIIYHVATTLDSYIAHEDHTIEGFIPEGDHADEYLESLKHYDTVIMGKKTYEFGYKFGLKPGYAAYPHMRNYIFSKTLEIEPAQDNFQIVDGNEISFIETLKKEQGTPVYLCGGGDFAGFLLENELIDQLILKQNPVIFGNGIRLFGKSVKQVGLSLENQKVYTTGVLLLTYNINY